ncbi:MAG TPA: hypothetical protein VK250_12380 [Nitrososphaeraceae archaeon]|nr:hypothetical protein [Nitrososphaeraceae archaeon]
MLIKAFPISYDRKRAESAFKLLLRHRESELKQIAGDIGYPTSGEHWQEKILLFCLDIDKCFLDLSKEGIEDNEVFKCMNLMKVMAKNKTNIEIQKIQNLAYTISADFKSFYEKQS